MASDPLDLDALQRVCDAATQGDIPNLNWLYPRDRAFVAAARTALPALIARLRTAEAERDDIDRRYSWLKNTIYSALVVPSPPIPDDGQGFGWTEQEFRDIVRAHVLAERERCAAVAEDHEESDDPDDEELALGEQIADAIRSGY